MGELYCLGDSLTFGFGVRRQERWTNLAQQQTALQVINFGCNGDTTGGILARLQTVLATQPRGKVLIMGGSNDIFYGGDMAGAKANIGALLQQTMAAGFQPIVGIPLPVDPANAPAAWSQVVDFERAAKLLEEYAAWLKGFCNAFGVEFVDFRADFLNCDQSVKTQLFLDGLHPNPAGHLLMAQRLCKYLRDAV